ncbi:MAG TPA: DNA-deoxyinosine glycosylase [Flavobacterium sp.]|nr:DNA-deoxyinosine glycosylase [Flavobacterium sp.]
MKSAFPPFAFPESTILILGTMPGEESLRLQQYYANKGNHFWKLMFSVFNEPFSSDYETRKSLLVKNHIAIWDVLAFCEREGSLDSKIKNEVANDFETFYDSHPNLRAVFFSSKAASKFYDKYAVRRKGIEYAILPSPSGANAGKTFSQKLEEWKILANYTM